MMSGIWKYGRMRARNFVPLWNNLTSQWLIDILPEVDIRQNMSLLSHSLLAKSELG